ncbi:MAG: Lrp/AsnC family transcriptional regulator [Desulfohalobiaceae bacterium]|nr:Lrp/AsnC family transcriptional regulator [Desulfohalobiaceae bacterium]
MNRPEDLTPEEQTVLRIAQDSLPDSPAPFQRLAEASGLTESQVISFLRRLKEEGFIRRFGATLRHQVAGYECNVMVAWQVEPSEAMEEVARCMSERPEITHVYQRRSCPEWPFNLYTMIHGRTEEECRNVVYELQYQTGVQRHEFLFSEGELKKTSMRYF